jgi:hypothetical protein
VSLDEPAADVLVPCEGGPRDGGFVRVDEPAPPVMEVADRTIGRSLYMLEERTDDSGQALRVYVCVT